MYFRLVMLHMNIFGKKKIQNEAIAQTGKHANIQRCQENGPAATMTRDGISQYSAYPIPGTDLPHDINYKDLVSMNQCLSHQL